MKRYTIHLLILLAVVTALVLPMTGCKKKATAAAASTAIRVNVRAAYKGDMASVINVSGDIKALKTTMLSAKIPGRVQAVPFREGDRVGAGTVVVLQDTSDLIEQVRQSAAALLGAKSRLSQAMTGAGLSDTQTEAQIRQAKAGLDSAKAQLQMIKKGARSQEVASTENNLASAKANFENAKVNLNRMRDLYSQGAIPKQQMDLTQMQYDIASAQYNTAEQHLSLVKAGARDEEIVTAQKQVVQAQEAFQIAKANRAQKSMRQDDIKSAQAAVAQSEASLDYARQQVANAHIAAPFGGTVAQRFTEPGQMASPGTPVMEIVALDSIYFEATVSEMDVDRLKARQTVQVSVDALPGRKYRGTVEKILPTADIKSRHFNVRIKMENRSGDLRPGMFARGNVEVAKHINTVIIPKDALTSNGKSQTVYTVAGGVARQRTVITGFADREAVEVLSGVSDSDSLVVVGQDKLSDGVKVDVVN